MTADMTRKQKRDLIKNKNIFKELVRVVKHFFPELIERLARVKDWRDTRYTTYQTDELLITILIGYMLGVGSMRNVSEKFNKDECIENIRQVLKKYDIEDIPHYDTINDFLELLSVKELEDLRTYMIKSFIEKRCFESFKFLNKYWLVAIDATGLYKFDERHCEHCLTSTFNKGTDKEYTIYYHKVLEAKLIIGDMVFSIETEFIENEKPDVEKQDCELNAFERLAEKMKNRFKRLPICILGDSLYACERLFLICEKHNWKYIVRFKEGRIKSVAEDFESIKKIESIQLTVENQGIKDTFTWTNNIEYNNRNLNLLEMTELIDNESTKFLWISSINVTEKNAEEIAYAGRGRWKIENQGFNVQKNGDYKLQHLYSENYNAMKNHYLICQMAHTIRQLLENGIEYLKELKISLKNISFELQETFRHKILTIDDILETEKRTQIRFL